MNTILTQRIAPERPKAPWKRLGVLAFAAASLALTPAHAVIFGFDLMAGAGVVLDHTDGTGSNARFFNPTSVAVGGDGSIYVADGGDHTIRKITAGGVVTTLAGSSGQEGTLDGAGSSARFVYPYAIAVDATGNLYVTDIGSQTIRKVTPSGSVSTLAGTAGVAGDMDGAGTAAQFNSPQGIAVDATGNVYVADTDNSSIRKITPNGTVSTFAGFPGQSGSSDGSGEGARFNFPCGLSVDAAGNVYVADFGNSTIREINPGAAVITLAGTAGQAGVADGARAAARFNHPGGVAVDAAGDIYVVDTSNQTIRLLTAAGNVTTIAGNPGIGGKTDASGTGARFFYPFGIAVNSSGTSVVVADTGNHIIRSVTSSGSVGTIAGAIGQAGSADGAGTSAMFDYPDGLAADSSGNVYVADHGNNEIRKISASGSVSTLAGQAGNPGSADGSGGAARFNGPTGVAVDPSGNVYVSDPGNSTIRKITSSGTVTTLAGSAGTAGSADGSGSAARFNNPEGIAVDVAGNVYVADTNNNTVRKITPAGVVTTLAGVAGQTGSTDGSGSSARFNGPYAVAVDGAGNVYVADYFNSTIREITAAGNVITVAGSAGHSGGADGPVGSARFNQPYGITVDGSGDIFVADTYNRAVREISGGSVTTLGGTLSRFYYPQGIAFDSAGNFYVADGDNQSVTKAGIVTAPPNNTTVSGQNASAGQNATFTVSSAASGLTYQWQVSTNSGSTWANLTDNSSYSGSTTATLTVNNVTSADNGLEFRALISNAAGSSTSGAGTLTVGGTTIQPPSGSARIINLSVRTQVGSGANILIVGMAIGGSGSKQMIIRGSGPALTQFGVGGVLASPQLTLFSGAGTQLTSNTGWGTAPNASAMSSAFAEVGAFPFTAGSPDCAIMQTLASGSYTAQIAGTGGTTGVSLAEFYDADGGDPSSRLTNASARAQVGTGANILIAGFVIGGSGSETVLVRGIGPGLGQFNVSGTLPAPQITVFDSTDTPIATNSGWDGSANLSAAFSAVGAFPLTPGSGDCAMLMTLSAGSYTVQLEGSGGGTGVGLVEVYEEP